MRTIGVVTVSRSDYGIYLPILRKIKQDSQLRLHLIVSGTHFFKEFGMTAKAIQADGFQINERVCLSHYEDNPQGTGRTMAEGVEKFSKLFNRSRPDILMVLGDRFDMASAALAALPFKIPVAHVHGGELTQGAIDDALRHAITKLSHLHFVSMEASARRVIQLGEEPWRVVITGAPSLDHLNGIKILKPLELQAKYGLRFVREKPLAVTFHPVTLEYEKTEWQVGELLSALEMIKKPVVFTMPNADTSHKIIFRGIRRFVKKNSFAQAVENLGTVGYWSLMAWSEAMVGNSSSGIIEAASFKLPVVNVGVRQLGRVRAANVIDVGHRRQEIAEGIRRATSSNFRKRLNNLVNPYGSGNASEKIVDCLKRVDLSPQLIEKRFHDIKP